MHRQNNHLQVSSEDFEDMNEQKKTRQPQIVQKSVFSQLLPESAVDDLQVSQTAGASGVPPLGLGAPVVCEHKQTFG